MVLYVCRVHGGGIKWGCEVDNESKRGGMQLEAPPVLTSSGKAPPSSPHLSWVFSIRLSHYWPSTDGAGADSYTSRQTPVFRLSRFCARPGLEQDSPVHSISLIHIVISEILSSYLSRSFGGLLGGHTSKPNVYTPCLRQTC